MPSETTIMLSTAAKFRAKELATLADDDLLDLYEHSVSYVEHEGWEYNVDAERALSDRLWNELERRTGR